MGTIAIYVYAAKAIEETEGCTISLEWSEVENAVKQLASKEGLLVEPASGAAFAAAKHIRECGIIRGKIVALLTGTGLKALEKKYTRRKIGLKASLKTEIMMLLWRERPLHGYAIWRRLQTNATPQAVYQQLKTLEKQGLIVSQISMGKRVYKLSEIGENLAKVLTEYYRGTP